MHMRRAGHVVARRLNCGVRRIGDVSATFEGDLIRPLGLVTLYFAYAEGELDDFIEVLSISESFDDEKRQWTVGKKLVHARRLLGQLDINDLPAIGALLDEGRLLFDQRNALVHGRLFAGGRLVSNRRSIPERRVTPDEITQLAEQIFNWKERIWAYRWKSIVPQLASLNRSGGA
jgi:hypothetical protein